MLSSLGTIVHHSRTQNQNPPVGFLNFTNSGSTLNDFQVRFIMTYNAKLRTDFQDVSFKDSNSNVIPFWIESVDSTNITAVIWLKIKNLTPTCVIR